jgi:hypothetical protein
MATLFLLLVAVLIGIFAFKVYITSETKQLTIKQAADEVKNELLKKFNTFKDSIVSKADKIKRPNKNK